MLFRQMRYFTAVVECNSFTEAAEQCYISQSAISQQIRALEYLRCYSGQELHQAVAEFSQLYPEVSISIVNGTHEELYDLLRFGGVDVILSDQRRAFSSQYENYQLLQCGCYAELSVRSHLSSQESVELESLKRIPCILISSREQQNTEQDYFQNTLGFGGNFLFAENLEEGRLMVAGNRGFLPIESVGTLPPAGATIRRLPIVRNGRQLQRNYCVFWLKEQTNYYIEEFAAILRKLLTQGET